MIAVMNNNNNDDTMMYGKDWFPVRCWVSDAGFENPY